MRGGGGQANVPICNVQSIQIIVHKKSKALVVYTISLINLLLFFFFFLKRINLLLLALKKTNRTSMHIAWCNASTGSYQFKTASSIMQIFHLKKIYISSWFFIFQYFIPSIILLVSFLLDRKDVKVVHNYILILCQTDLRSNSCSKLWSICNTLKKKLCKL